MKGVYMGNQYAILFQPENIILLGNSSMQKLRAEEYISEAKNQCPDRFSGRKDFSHFNLW